MPSVNEDKQTSSKLSPLRTFKSDAANFIKSENFSLAEIVANRQNRGEKSFFRPQKSKKLITGISFALVLAVFSLFFVFFVLKKFEFQGSQKDHLLNTEKNYFQILPCQKSIVFEGSSSKEFSAQFRKAETSLYGPGDLICISLQRNEKTLTSQDFLTLINPQAPPVLKTFLKKDFLLGILSLDKNYPLLIFRLDKENFNSVFSGMLQWEIFLDKDLNFFWPTASSSPILGRHFVFKDDLVQNHQVRIGKNKERMLIYGILNQEYIIITNSRTPFKELIHRFLLFKLL